MKERRMAGSCTCTPSTVDTSQTTVNVTVSATGLAPNTAYTVTLKRQGITGVLETTEMTDSEGKASTGYSVGTPPGRATVKWVAQGSPRATCEFTVT